MITVTIQQTQSKEYKAVQALGHAGFGRKGTDIVCAAVSILFINTLNAIETLTEDKDKMQIVSNEAEGLIDCRFCGLLSEQSNLLLDAMVLGLTNIQEQYSSKYIRIIFQEA